MSTSTQAPVEMQCVRQWFQELDPTAKKAVVLFAQLMEAEGVVNEVANKILQALIADVEAGLAADSEPFIEGILFCLLQTK